MTAAGKGSARFVFVVDRDEHRATLLGRFLEARGWKVEVVTDPRRVIRRCSRATPAPMIVLEIDEHDPDAFELLGALAARAIVARVVAGARTDLDLRAARVDRVLPLRSRFADVAGALEDLHEGYVVRDAAE